LGFRHDVPLTILEEHGGGDGSNSEEKKHSKTLIVKKAKRGGKVVKNCERTNTTATIHFDTMGTREKGGHRHTPHRTRSQHRKKKENT